MSVLVLFAYIAVPVLEIATIVWVAGIIGGWWTVGALLGCSLLGASLVGRGGRRTIAALQEAVAHQRPPDAQLSAGALVFMGGTLLLIPGFLSSAVGIVLAAPPARPLTRRWLAWLMRRRMLRYAEAVRAAQERAGAGPAGGPGPADGSSAGSGPAGTTGPTIIQGDVLSSTDSRTTGPSDAEDSSH